MSLFKNTFPPSSCVCISL